MTTAKVIVATHKDYFFPEDQLYLPVFVGASVSRNAPVSSALKKLQRDDDGRNISAKNPFFCELTGLYWAWKNPSKLNNPQAIGLAHYRRYLGAPKKMRKVLTLAQAEQILETADLILPRPRRYYIENLYDHYTHTMEAAPLIKTSEILRANFAEFWPEFDRLKHRTSAHMFNIFIMKREVLDDYCAWLFAVLFELEKTMNFTIKNYDPFQARFYGRISELLLDVFLKTRGIKNFVEVPVVDMEPVNWFLKGGSFLRAKFYGKKYDRSF